MERDERVFVMGEDVGQRGGVFLATQGFIEDFGPQRVMDTPLAEASIMGIALGAAFRGMRPIPEVQFSDFVWPSVNQLIGEAARSHYGTNGALKVPMTVRIPYGGGIRGGLFHSQNVEALFFHTPGLLVVTPSTPYEAKGLLKSAIRDDNPVIFLEHKKTYRLVRGEVPDEEYTLPIGPGGRQACRLRRNRRELRPLHALLSGRGGGGRRRWHQHRGRGLADAEAAGL